VVLGAAAEIGFMVWHSLALLWLSLFLLLVASFDNRVATAIVRTWLGLSNLIGRITSPIALSLVFYVVIVPFGFLFGRFNPSLRAHFFQKGKSTYFFDAEHEFTKESFDVQY
jgi:hypothetical protein